MFIFILHPASTFLKRNFHILTILKNIYWKTRDLRPYVLLILKMTFLISPFLKRAFLFRPFSKRLFSF